MKIQGIPGEYYFHAIDVYGKICECLHATKGDAIACHTEKCIWPIEIMDGTVYAPTEEELKDAR